MSTTRQQKTVQISFRCPRDLFERFKRVAEANDRTVSGELRRAIKIHLGRQ